MLHRESWVIGKVSNNFPSLLLHPIRAVSNIQLNSRARCYAVYPGQCDGAAPGAATIRVEPVTIFFVGRSRLALAASFWYA